MLSGQVRRVEFLATTHTVAEPGFDIGMTDPIIVILH
jgi:hypothetical protein